MRAGERLREACAGAPTARRADPPFYVDSVASRALSVLARRVFPAVSEKCDAWNYPFDDAPKKSIIAPRTAQRRLWTAKCASHRLPVTRATPAQGLVAARWQLN